MATTKGLGWFDTTYYGPTYTEDIDAINQGIEQGLKIGTAVRERQAENRRQQADYEANRQKQIVNELTLNKLDNESREGLILKPASKSDNLNDARIDFSNMLVDKFNQLKIARDAGDLTAADYSKGLMVLQQQVPAYKAAEKIMYTGAEQYLDALDDGTLSESNDPEALEFWGAIARGDANVNYKIGDDGNIFLTGTWNDSNGKAQPIDAALKEMERLPFLSKKPETTVKQQLEADVSNILATKKGNAMKAFNEKTGKYQEDYNPISNPDGTPTTWFKQFADESFDGYFGGLGGGNKKKALKEYLLDSLEVQDRVELMDKLAQYTNKSDKNGSAESYGLATVNELVNDLKPDQIKSFINSTVKGSWVDQTRNAVLKANKELIDKANLAQSEASLEYRKDLANARKAEYQAESARVDYAKKSKEGTPKGNSIGLTQIYNQIMATPVAGLSKDPRELASTTDPYIDRIKSALQSGPEKYFIDLDDEGNYLLGKAGMKDQKKKRVIDPSRIKNIDFLMKEIATLNNETWKQPITVK